MPDPAATIARIAARQQGVITRSQLLTAGFTERQVALRVRACELRRIHTSVYVVAGAPETWRQAAAAAGFAIGSEGAVSFRTAAALWHLDVAEPPPIEVTLAMGAGGRRLRGATVHRTRLWLPGDRCVVGGIRVTCLDRTLVDLASCLPESTAARILDDALARRLTRPSRLVRTADRLASQGRRGPNVIRRIVAPWLDDLAAESVAEMELARRLAEAGIPSPSRQHEVRDAASSCVIARVDFAWPDRRLAVEVDGFRWHDRADRFAADSTRSNRLAAAGWHVLRVTPTEIRADLGPFLAALSLRLAHDARSEVRPRRRSDA